MFYAILIFALTMASVAALQFFYVMFLEGALRQHKRRIAELERRQESLTVVVEELRLRRAEAGEVFWPEVVDEDDYPVR